MTQARARKQGGSRPLSAGRLRRAVTGAAVAASLVLAACATNPVTGRSQFIMIPASQDVALGAQAFAEVRQSEPVVTTGPDAERLQRIGAHIARVAKADAPHLQFEFVIIEKPTVNAWALPGGKIAIYRGMLNRLEDDHQVAAVLGHEAAHAVLRHGAERVSRAQATNLVIGAAGVGLAAGTDGGSQMAGLAITAAALATQIGSALPHSRLMELEADDIGTLYMARAGYDPRAAVRVWQIMMAKRDGGSPPQWLSTHPADHKRIAQLQSRMGVYMAEYQRAGGRP